MGDPNRGRPSSLLWSAGYEIQAGVPVVAGPHMGRTQCHHRIAQCPTGVLQIGDMVQLNTCHAPDMESLAVQ